MAHYDHLREIAVLPCLPAGLSVEDRTLQRSAPSFGPLYAMPDDAFADVLGFLNISKRDYLDGVRAKYGINLLGRDATDPQRGPWRSAPAADWRALRVDHNRKRPALLTLEQLFEVMDNAGYGGQLAIAGYVDRDFCLPRQMTAVTLIGKFQIGIVDYIWGSGHTVTFDGSLTVDLTRGQIGDAPGYPYDSGCDFVVDFFRFRSLARADLPDGVRFDAKPAPPTLKRAA